MATRRERAGLAPGKITYTDNILPKPSNVLDEFCNVWNENRIGKFNENFQFLGRRPGWLTITVPRDTRRGGGGCKNCEFTLIQV